MLEVRKSNFQLPNYCLLIVIVRAPIPIPSSLQVKQIELERTNFVSDCSSITQSPAIVIIWGDEAGGG